MIRITVVFYSILYGRQVSEWTIDPLNCEAVSSTISYLTASGLKRMVSINFKPV